MPTLTIHPHTLMNDGMTMVPPGTYGFVRSKDPQYFGRGDWIVVKARSKEMVPGTILSLVLQMFLAEMARKMNIPEEYNFCRVPPPRPKESKRRTRVSSGNTSRRGMIVAGFNPLAG